MGPIESPSTKKKRPRPEANPFLDLEARVNDSESEDDHEEDSDGDRFIVPDSPGALRSATAALPAPDEHEDLEEFAKTLKQRYSRSSPDFSGKEALGHANTQLYEVRVSRGREEGLARSLSKSLPDGITHVFALPRLSGRIYVEAEGRLRAEAATQGRKIKIVSQEESIALVAWLDQSQRFFRKGSWVRFRGGVLGGDLGIVVQSSEVDDLTTVAAVPRIPLRPTPPAPLRHLKRRRADAALRVLFDPQSVEAAFGKGSVEKVEDKYIFEKRTYVSGLCIQTLEAARSLVEEPRPELEDVLLFRKSGWNEISSSVADALRCGSIRKTWQPGDRVDIVRGELKGLSGELKSVDFEGWSAEIELLIGAENSSQHVSLDTLVRCISVGANVVAVAGHNKERHGVVVSSDCEYVTFIEDKTKEEVTVLALLVKSYTPDFIVVPPSSVPAQALAEPQNASREDALIGHRVLIGHGSAWKGLIGEIREVGRETITVAFGLPYRFTSCGRNQLIDLETGRALDGRDLGSDWPETRRRILLGSVKDAPLERQPTPPPETAEHDNWSVELQSAMDVRSRTPEIDDACLVQTQPSFDGPGMFLLDPTIWGTLGDRRVWVCLGIGFDGGRHFRRRARIEEPLPYGRQDVEKLSLGWTNNKGVPKCELVPIVHLGPTPPGRDKEGIVLKGPRKGCLIRVKKSLQSKKVLWVSVGAEEWEELQENVCWVEHLEDSCSKFDFRSAPNSGTAVSCTS